MQLKVNKVWREMVSMANKTQNSTLWYALWTEASMTNEVDNKKSCSRVQTTMTATRYSPHTV